jgi:hypothetical protein
MTMIHNVVVKKSIEKEVKKMKKLIAILTVCTMVFSQTGAAFAEFSEIAHKTFQANVAVGGTPRVTIPFSATLHEVEGDDETGGAISWSGVTAGATAWKAANQYIQVQGFTTFSQWGIQIYTNNTDYTGTGNPAGLVRQDNKIFSLPVCWRTIVSAKATIQELQINQGTSGGFTVLYDGVAGHQPGGASQYFPWFFMLDKRTPDVNAAVADNQPFGNYQQEATFIGSDGYHHAPGAVNYATPISPTVTYNLYLGANFTLAVPGKTYTTNSLTVQFYNL